MVLGMSLSAFTLLHVVLSLLGIGSGLAVAYGFLTASRLNGITAFFLVTTVLTSVTGFLFPVEHILPSHIVGVISLLVLAIAVMARYISHMAGPWRWIYVVSATVALYLNCFVLVFQSFLKVPALHELAPTQKEPPFIIAQLVVMAVFVALGILSVKRFRLEPVLLPTGQRGDKAA